MAGANRPDMAGHDNKALAVRIDAHINVSHFRHRPAARRQPAKTRRRRHGAPAMKFLLVDHTPIYRNILRQALQGYRDLDLELAASIAEGRALAGGGAYQFIAVARHLPDGDGLDLVRELRGSGRYPFEPMILLTSSPTAALAQEAEQAGVTEIFRKHDIGELVSFLGRFLGIFTPLRGRVLYVEDAREQRQLLEEQLRAWGMEVDALATAEDAWTAYQAQPYDLVVCDIVLSGRMTGARLVNRIRRLPGSRGDVPILAITAFDSTARRIELFHLGVDDYVGKPAVPLELRARIQSLLARKLAADRDRALVDAVSLAALQTDAEGIIQSANPEAAALFGLPADKLLGRPVAGLLAAADAEFIQRHLAAPDTRGLPWECDAHRGDGTPLAARYTVIESASLGARRQFTVLLRDISTEKELQRQLMLARDAAEAASRLKSEFLANMSHEIRTPMNGIIGMTQLALDGRLGAEERDYVQKAHDSARFLLGVLNDILDLSKIEADKLQFAPAPFDLGEILRRISDLFLVRVREKGIALRFETAADVPCALIGDALRFAQVLTNLVGNAVKFTHHGEIVVRSTLAGTDPRRHRAHLRFEVADTGIGIETARIDRLFQAFNQADPAIASEYGGSGLGLAICKHLAAMMDGDIGVTSTPGQGSNFHFDAWFELPEAESSQPPAPAPVHPGLAGLNVLVVEDNPINRDLACRYLDRAGIVASTAGNGGAATEILDRQPGHFQLVLMDVNMPVMDGIAATRRIRQNPAHDDLPIVAMTANAMAEDRRRCLDAGMQDFLAKPFDRDDLYAMIGRWCGRGAPAIARPAPAPHAEPASDDDPLDEYPQALERMSDDPEMHAAVMNSFLAAQADVAAEIRVHLATGHVDAACRAAHTLKGLAATVGAGPLRRAASTLEIALEGGTRRDDWPALADRLEQSFVALRQAWRDFPTD
jgi:PAS domain S-box-containing protein